MTQFTVVTRARIHPHVRIMRGGAYGHTRAHTYQIFVRNEALPY
jgi:hypothetical protein